MKNKTLLKQVLSATVFSGLIIFAIFLLNFIPKNSFEESQVALSENGDDFSSQEEASVGLPVQLKIPKIEVDANIIEVGITANGEMDVPKLPEDTAWFNLGPRPGEEGSAVITGHYGWENKNPAVFDNLHELQIGDKIFTEDDAGIIATFVVYEIRTYDNKEETPNIFSSNDGKAHLNLVTCTGDWNKTENTFSDRLVIFSRLERLH